MEPIPTHYTPEMSFLSMNIRSRREMNTRDAANIRQFEHWQTDAPYLQYDRPDLKGAVILNDMNPTDSRKLDSKPYFQNPTLQAGKDGFKQNPYFQDYAPAYDPRNAVRELRSAVFEDRFDRGVMESKRLLGRNFTNTWEPADWVQKKNLDTLRAYEELKPQFDNPTESYRKVKINQNS